MRFPNALEGVKKIYKAEIIGLLGALIMYFSRRKKVIPVEDTDDR